jgi:hypothetical protein
MSQDIHNSLDRSWVAGELFDTCADTCALALSSVILVICGLVSSIVFVVLSSKTMFPAVVLTVKLSDRLRLLLRSHMSMCQALLVQLLYTSTPSIEADLAVA